MGVYWAKPTLDDIAAQRAMIERGEEIRKAARQAEERERLRDTFAAAALTGLLSNDYFSLGDDAAKRCYEYADAMFRERGRYNAEAVVPEWSKGDMAGCSPVESDASYLPCPRRGDTGVAAGSNPADSTHDAVPQSRSGQSTAEAVPEVAKCTERENEHDAAPDARAESDEARTDKAATSHRREGTGNTPSEAEIDALEFVVEEGRTASLSDYGILRSWLIRLRPEWESQSYEESDEKRVNTTTNRGIDRAAYEGDIVSRLKHWRGLHLAHSGELFEEAASEIERLRTLAAHTTPHEGSVQAQCTLTDEEREAVELADAYMSAAGCHNTNVQKTLRKLLERLK